MPTLTVRVLGAYSLPALPLAMLYLPLFTYLTPFYVAERGVDLAALGAALIAIRLFDAISDPAMGWVSDRTRARLGRRFWVAASVPLIMLSAWMAFVPPADAGLGHAVLWLFVITLGWTMAQTPYGAWGAELAPDYDGRIRVTSWREAVVLIGTLAATLIYLMGGEGGAGLKAIAIAILVLLPLTVALSVFGAPERVAGQTVRLTIAEGWRTIRENQPFRRLLVAWFVNGAANALPATLFLFFVADRIGAPEDVGWIILVYFLSAVAGVPFWAWLARRTSKHRAWGIAMIYACAVFASVLFLGEGDLAAYAVMAVLTGTAFGADLSLPPAIQADVVALDTRETGAERAGLFFAIWQVATQAALALSSGIGLIVLDGSGFVPGEMNTPDALWTLTVLYAGVPIVLKLGAVALMWRFDLDRTAVDGAAGQAAS